MKVWIPHRAGRALLGDLPPGVTVELLEDPARLPSSPAGVRFWVPPFLAGPEAGALLAELPDLAVVQLLSAGADAWVGRVPAGVTLCDARGVHDSATAEWVVAAVLCALRGFAPLARAQARHEWAYAEVAPTDELAGKRVLIVGAGSIGAAVRARLAPFEVTFTLVARTPRPAEGVHGVDELPALLPEADIVVLLVPLTEQTRGLVDEKFLAAMPDGALLVNAARGPVARTSALVAELASGRLRAALDVTDPEPLPADHPLWELPNVLLTPHVAGSVRGLLPRAYRLVGEQLRRFVTGEPLANRVVDGY
ncbi:MULTISPECIES: 2-hydroxyacid dehydrogenase [Micromonospora]|uniref:Phosphoglycerate dehydrogenase n=1 Tax=Micromonospora solifontis TaxID=2487138 RepID=A0ABX9WJH3_9ACTN|nr:MULTISPECIES: 2-hydroxyacid dehydrogenase [Micromonospora]NES14090.1 2-hydroxyacid dehydrogenase [Micromonospora sp. PPF5-17B]NES35720.1 2-hydroxyacid dehydrogenase [Micromonospora solifontis]NES56033.1 2-hydroxyacid dehydrogenase [Micromonospora sp. PPF5-6]RNM00396.1 phosphoglycerate dehydrogenase [Micromonospora solifontis]